MDVKGLLIETLQSFNYPIYLQGSLSDDDEYPDSFFTFFNNGTSDDRFYNNTETCVIWDLDLNIYSIDPSIVNSTLRTVKPLLKAAGFIVEGLGYDIPSDQPSHTGRGINLIYVENVR